MAPASMSSDEEVKRMDLIGWYFQLRTHTWKLIRFFLGSDAELQVPSNSSGHSLFSH